MLRKRLLQYHNLAISPLPKASTSVKTIHGKKRGVMKFQIIIYGIICRNNIKLKLNTRCQ